MAQTGMCRCKKPVIAEKRFTIHEAPLVLTVHLKRFSPLGRKISHYVDYDDRLSLHPFMSEGQHGFSYSLYGVICHVGGGPNSGHYFAYVKDKDSRWWEMNDEMVSPIGSAPVSKKNAYILFYMRNKGQVLEAALHSTPVPPPPKAGLTASMKKRKEREPGHDDEDTGEKVTKPFIGPVIPDSLPSQRASEASKVNGSQTDMQSILLKKKIEAAKLLREKDKHERDRVVKERAKEKAAGLLAGLDSYNSDDEDTGDEDQAKKDSTETITGGSPSSPITDSPTKPSETLPVSPVSPTSLVPPSSPSKDSPTSNGKKRKRVDDNHYRNTPSKSDGHRPTPISSRTSGYTSFKPGRNPYNSLSSLTKVKKYGKRRPGI